MTYRQGELIVASDFNTFRTDILDIYDVGTGDSGYGQIDTGGAAAIPTVSVGEVIKSVEWEAFRAAAEVCSSHQGSVTTFPIASELAVGEIIEAHELDDGNVYDINSSLGILDTNRLIPDAGSVTVFPNALNSVRGVAWSSLLIHRFTVTFPTVDDARYFFNSGGDIRIRGSRSGGSATPQNTSWTDLLADMGTVIFNHNDTLITGALFVPTAIGYYDLTTSFQRIGTGTPASGPYSGGTGTRNEVTLEVRSVDGPSGPNGDNGRILEFIIQYVDAHLNPFSDVTDGTITSDVDYRRATSPLTIQTPVFATVIGLASGV